MLWFLLIYSPRSSRVQRRVLSFSTSEIVRPQKLFAGKRNHLNVRSYSNANTMRPSTLKERKRESNSANKIIYFLYRLKHRNYENVYIRTGPVLSAQASIYFQLFLGYVSFSLFNVWFYLTDPFWRVLFLRAVIRDSKNRSVWNSSLVNHCLIDPLPNVSVFKLLFISHSPSNIFNPWDFQSSPEKKTKRLPKTHQFESGLMILSFQSNFQWFRHLIHTVQHRESLWIPLDTKEFEI